MTDLGKRKTSNEIKFAVHKVKQFDLEFRVMQHEEKLKIKMEQEHRIIIASFFACSVSFFVWNHLNDCDKLWKFFQSSWFLIVWNHTLKYELVEKPVIIIWDTRSFNFYFFVLILSNKMRSYKMYSLYVLVINTYLFVTSKHVLFNLPVLIYTQRGLYYRSNQLSFLNQVERIIVAWFNILIASKVIKFFQS